MGMILVTKWFGSFIVDAKTNRIVDKRLMPRDPEQCAHRMAVIQRGGLTDEERELAQGRERLSVSDRRQAELGKPEMFDSSFIRPADYGFDPAFMHEAMMMLGALRTSEPVPRDRSLVQAIRALDDLIEASNLLDERLHEWYGMHFPELADMAEGNRYASLVAEFGDRGSVLKVLDSDIESLGGDLDPADLEAARSLAQSLEGLYDGRKRLNDYIDSLVAEMCPNMCAILGGALTARLISLAGGLERLASLPSSTVQLLGAEKAMFRHLRSGKAPPKHGVIYQYATLRNAPYWQRGKIARALAGKVLIAAKIDQYKGEFAGDRLNEELKARIADIKRRYPDPPKKPAKKAKQGNGRPNQHGGKPHRGNGKPGKGPRRRF